MKQVIPSNTGTLATSGTTYAAVSSGGYSISTESATEQLIGSAGKLSSLRIRLNTAPGSGKSWTFTLRLNGADTACVVTISDTATTGVDAAHEITVAAGDRVSIGIVPSGTPASTKAQTAITYEGTTSKESVILSTSRSDLSVSATQYFHLNGDGITTGLGTTESDYTQIIPTAGKIRKLYVSLTAAPGTGKTRTFTLMVNGSPSALTCAVSNSATTANDTAHDVTVAAGDEVSVRSEVSGTPTAATVKLGTVFLADTNGESVILGCVGSASSGYTVDYYLGLGGASADESSETNTMQIGNACTLKNLYVKMKGAPGSGASSVYSVRVNQANPANTLSATVTDPATTANDTTHTVTVADGDRVDLFLNNTNTTDRKKVGWGLVCLVPNVVYQTMTETATWTDSVVKSIARTFAEASANTDVFLKYMAKTFSESNGWSDAMVRSISKTLSDAATWTDSLSITKTLNMTLSEASAWADSVVRSLSRAFSEASAWTDSVTGQVIKTVIAAEASAWNDAVTINKTINRVMADIATWADSLTAIKTLNMTLSEASAWADSVIRSLSRAFSEASGWTDSLTMVKAINKALSESSTWTDAVTRRLSRTFSEAATWTDVYIRNAIMTLVEASSWAAALTRSVGKRLTETLAWTDKLKVILNGFTAGIWSRIARPGATWTRKDRP